MLRAQLRQAIHRRTSKRLNRASTISFPIIFRFYDKYLPRHPSPPCTSKNHIQLWIWWLKYLRTNRMHSLFFARKVFCESIDPISMLCRSFLAFVERVTRQKKFIYGVFYLLVNGLRWSSRSRSPLKNSRLKRQLRKISTVVNLHYQLIWKS